MNIHRQGSNEKSEQLDIQEIREGQYIQLLNDL